MDTNLLVISVGNTRTAIGAFVDGRLGKVRRVESTNQAELQAAIGEVWQEFSEANQTEVAGATVNPPVTERIEHAVKEVTGKTMEWVGQGIDLPIKVVTKEPGKTGVDRVLNVAAAYEQLEKACVVVDAGTAVTVSFCNDKGDFLGGVIAPGAAMQLRALHEHTAKLPLVELAEPMGLFGTDTTSAIQHGVYQGIRGLVKEVVENFASHLEAWPELIATGGDAQLLFGGWELVHAISPDLTLYGIALAYVRQES